MYCNTSFGDYPHYLPQEIQNNNHATLNGSGFTGWMLLNYNKPVQVSSTLGGFVPNNAVDENIKTYWSAVSGNKGEWIITDLGASDSVCAIQINYADQDVESQFLGKQMGIFHQYILYHSNDGQHWSVLVNKSANKTDIPHEYVELAQPVKTRYIKLENIHMPTGKFAISGLRVFGKGLGAIPDTVKNFTVLRTEKDKRSAWLKWQLVDNAYAYNIYFGTDPNKLYNAIMVYNQNEYWYKGMDKEKAYYFSIEAINENGISKKTTPILVP
jgi:hypothetical protein